MRINDRKGATIYQYDHKLENNPYQTEHDELFAAIAKGEYRFCRRGAWSKEYHDRQIQGGHGHLPGQVLDFEKTMNSGFSLQPSRYARDADMPTKPDANVGTMQSQFRA